MKFEREMRVDAPDNAVALRIVEETPMRRPNVTQMTVLLKVGAGGHAMTHNRMRHDTARAAKVLEDDGRGIGSDDGGGHWPSCSHGGVIDHGTS